MTHLGNTLVAAGEQAAPLPGEAQQVREREQVYAAIASGDAEVARAAMRLHLTNCLVRARASAT